MATYSGNDVYISINGTDVAARWRSAELSLASDEEDTSAGAGITWKSRAAKLQEVQMTVILIYDDADADGDFDDLYDEDMIVEVIYGPEGNTAGKPCHQQNFKINNINGPTTNHDKTLVTLEYDMVSTGAPTKNIYEGDTF